MDFLKTGEDHSVLFSVSMYDSEFVQLMVKALQDKSAKIEADPRLKDARLLTASKTRRGITFHFVWEDE